MWKLLPLADRAGSGQSVDPVISPSCIDTLYIRLWESKEDVHNSVNVLLSLVPVGNCRSVRCVFELG